MNRDSGRRLGSAGGSPLAQNRESGGGRVRLRRPPEARVFPRSQLPQLGTPRRLRRQRRPKGRGGRGTEIVSPTLLRRRRRPHRRGGLRRTRQPFPPQRRRLPLRTRGAACARRRHHRSRLRLGRRAVRRLLIRGRALRRGNAKSCGTTHAPQSVLVGRCRGRRWKAPHG